MCPAGLDGYLERYGDGRHTVVENEPVQVNQFSELQASGYGNYKVYMSVESYTRSYRDWCVNTPAMEVLQLSLFRPLIVHLG